MPKPKKKAQPKKPNPKTNNAVLMTRVEEVLRIRLDGAQMHDVREYSSENKWGVTDRTLQDYINRADALLVERQEKSRKKVVAKRLAQRETLYARAVNSGDLRTALAVLDSADKLRGLFPEREMKELLKLAAAQGAQLAELKRRLEHAHTGTADPPATEAEGGGSGRDDGATGDAPG